MLCDFIELNGKVKSLISSIFYLDNQLLEMSRTSKFRIFAFTNVETSFLTNPNISSAVFETLAPYSVPNNYFQRVLVNESKLPNRYSNGSITGFSFIDDKFIFISKSIVGAGSRSMYGSFVLLSLKKSDLNIDTSENIIRITFSSDVEAYDLIADKDDVFNVSFTFTHSLNPNNVISRASATSSDRVRSILQRRIGSPERYFMNLPLGFTASVPFFIPHPFLLNEFKSLGFESKKEMILKTREFVISHLL